MGAGVWLMVIVAGHPQFGTKLSVPMVKVGLALRVLVGEVLLAPIHRQVVHLRLPHQVHLRLPHHHPLTQARLTRPVPMVTTIWALTTPQMVTV